MIILEKMEPRSNELLTVFVLCFYGFSLGSIGIRARWFYLIMVLISFLLICINESCIIKIKETRLFRAWMAVYLSIVFFVLLPMSRHESEIINYVIYLTIITIMYSQIRTDHIEVQKIIDVMIITATVISIYIIFATLCSGLYRSLVVPMLSSATKKVYLINSAYGYGPAIGNSYTFADSAIVLGVCAVLGKDVVKEGGLFKNRLLLLLMLSGVLLEGRKTEFLAVILTIVYISIFGNDLKKRDHVELRIFFAAVVVLLLVATLVELYNLGLLKRFVVMAERISSKKVDQSVDYTSGRFTLWKNAIKLFSKNPIFGAGWGRFANYTTGVFKEVSEDQTVRDVHNVPLQLLCETGIIGTAIIFCPFLYILHVVVRHNRQLKAEQNFTIERKCNIFSLGIIVYSLIVSFLDPNFYGHFYWCLLLIAMVFEEYSYTASIHNLLGISESIIMATKNGWGG